MNILITGGSGGIGLAFIKRCLDKLPDARLDATYFTTKPTFQHVRLVWHLVDLTDEKQVMELADSVDKVDWLINAVGMLHDQNSLPEKTVRSFGSRFFLDNIRINSLPALLLAKHFQNQLKQSDGGRFVVISARVGSISDNHLGGWYSYRASKAALNMALKTLSIEWQRTLPRCCVTAFHPGTTDTSLSKPFQEHVPEGKLFAPEKSAEYLLDTVSRLTPEQSGKFWSWDGSELPW